MHHHKLQAPPTKIFASVGANGLRVTAFYCSFSKTLTKTFSSHKSTLMYLRKGSSPDMPDKISFIQSMMAWRSLGDAIKPESLDLMSE